MYAVSPLICRLEARQAAVAADRAAFAHQAKAVEQGRDGVQHRAQLAGLQDTQVALQRGQKLEVVTSFRGQLRRLGRNMSICLLRNNSRAD